MSNKPEHPNPERLYRHRRWMAWSGMVFSAVAWCTGMALSYSMPEHAEGSIHPLVTAALWAGLIPMAAYVGNCAVDQLASLRK